MLSLVAGMVHIATPAHATDISKGSSLGWSDQKPEDWQYSVGGDLIYTDNHYSNLNVVNDRGVALWSGGGHANDGHDGGYGGTVELFQYGALAGSRAANAVYADWGIKGPEGNYRWLSDPDQRFTSVNVVPLIFLYSQGGVGGDKGNDSRGRGGRGGNATLDLYASLTTTGDNYAGAWVSSSGFHSGWGDSGADQVTYLNNDLPSAGDTWGFVKAGGSITTSGGNSPGMVVESVGADGGGTWPGALNGVPSKGGNGGKQYGATAGNDGSITTNGANSPAMIVQSLGGQGSQQQRNSGRSGGDGGNALAADASNTGTIDTSGANSYGIAAYSVGGFGASGSNATKGNGHTAGDAGANGNAGSVTVSNKGSSASITTRGQGAYGILAQSLGGGLDGGYYNPHADETSGHGGNGKRAGGSGSRGGAAGAVSVTNQGSIETQGNDAAAILAQSLGGLGGDGGNATSGGIFFAMALGGDGGPGGAPGKVTINNDSASGQIVTHGDSSAGVFAQSVGGGGGAGGAAKARSVGIGISVSVAIGGSGGDGGLGDAVSVTNRSSISTAGENSAGIFAQSIGGGGGLGGSASAIAAAFSADILPSVSVSVSIGGSGGSGATGGTVRVDNYANIRTLGTSSYGIAGQSIGGGGGDGGGATSYVLSASQIALGSPVAVGASGGNAGNASWIALANYGGAIATSGNGAYGIYGQSVGGGGGNAGNATALADIYKVDGFGGAINVAIGGSGGGGGNGATVTLRNDSNGEVTTAGVFTHGLFAQSVGGGGGNGGSADSSAGTGIIFGDKISEWLSESRLGEIAAIKVALGGSGGSGGHGDVVTVTNTGQAAIRTQGSNSHGIFAQSIGGGGGNAGSYASGGQNRLSFEVGVGGTGGSGGHGGQVTVTNDAGSTIATEQDGSHGIFAQSIGGGGGNGGNLTAEKEMFTDLGGIFVDNVKRIVGYDYVMEWAEKNGYKDDYEILKGMAEIVDDTGITDKFQKEFKETLIEKISGSKLKKDYEDARDTAEKAGDVDEDGKEDGEGTEKKPESKFPNLSLTVGVGGKGGSGGGNDGVVITNNGAISTAGNVSYGIFAQSVSGGGGVGGLGGSLNKDGSEINLNVAVGGSGGSGGMGGTVSITNGGSVTTLRDGSYGLFAQSVGGGGGLAGGSTSPETKKFTANVAVGGNGGPGNSGGSITINNSGSVKTSGIESHAIVAQSIGGGGGAAVMNLGDESEPTNEEMEKIKERLETTDKIATIMGAAGTRFLKTETAEEHMKRLKEKALEEASFTVHIGGKGGSGATGGAVQVAHSGSIVTEGEAAFGIMAQSVGGGGGLFSKTGEFDKKHGHQFSVGGADGSGGNGGDVTVSFTGQNASITTSGNGAHGLFTQSVGGGGGYLGRISEASSVNVGDSKTSGNGGRITINGNASIVTTGQGASGIFAQSVGGGGAAWTNVDGYTIPETGTGARTHASGTGGQIDIQYGGAISATGENAYAILAQSGRQMTNGAIDPTVSGGPINITFTSGAFVGGAGNGAAIRIDGGSLERGNTIAVSSDATISAVSGNAIIGGAAPDFVNIDGTVIGNIDLAPGAFDNHSQGTVPNIDPNTLNNIKYDLQFNRAASNALLHKFDQLLVEQDNAIQNMKRGAYNVDFVSVNGGGRYQSVDNGSVKLGPGRLFAINQGGTLDIGGTGNISSLAVHGTLLLDRSSLLVDVDVSPQTGEVRNDTISATGGIISMGSIHERSSTGMFAKTYAVVDDGTIIKPNVVNGLMPVTFVIVDDKTPLEMMNYLNQKPSGQYASESNISVQSNDGSPIIWDLDYYDIMNPWGETPGLSITPDADFVGTAQFYFNPTSTELSLLTGLQNEWDNGNRTHAALFGYFANIQSGDQYHKAIDSLSTEGYSSGASAQTLGASTSMGAAMSCPVFTDAGVTIGETQCVWARVSGSHARQDGDRPAKGFKQDEFSYRIGAQWEIAPQWFFGATAAYFSSELTSKNGTIKSDGKGGDVSVALKHQMGNWLFAASGHFGYGSYDTSHRITIGRHVWGLSADQDVWTAGVRLRAAYEIALPGFYIRPYLDLDAVHTYMPSFTSRGNFMHAYHFDAMREWTLSASPAVEIGTRIDIDDKSWLRPYASIGASFLHESELQTKVRLEAAGANFASTHKMDNKFLDVGAGLQFFSNDQLELRAEYKARIGDKYIRHDAIGRMSIKF